MEFRATCPQCGNDFFQEEELMYSGYDLLACPGCEEEYNLSENTIIDDMAVYNAKLARFEKVYKRRSSKKSDKTVIDLTL